MLSLLAMSEIEREDILAQRQEEIQRMQMKSQLDQMVRDQSGARKDDSVAKAAKRTFNGHHLNFSLM